MTKRSSCCGAVTDTYFVCRTCGLVCEIGPDEDPEGTTESVDKEMNGPPRHKMVTTTYRGKRNKQREGAK